MKTILVPTDFSEASQNAINYAVEFARVMGANIILFHAYYVPPMAIEAQNTIPALMEIEKECKKKLEEIKIAALRNLVNADLSITCVCTYGFAVDEIIEYSKNNKIDVIVMGMVGAGWLNEKLFGSVTTAVMRDCQCPVLSIGAGMKFETPKKIVFAYDFREVESYVLKPLLDLADFFSSKIFVLNVDSDRDTVNKRIKDAVKNTRIESMLKDADHTFHYRTGDDLLETIGKFVGRQKANMVVVVPREHSFLKNLFNEPFTKQAAFHLKVPLLSLHE